jgi:site-specific recombinase XerC
MRFQLGLVLMLGWRIPMRARNWSEALIGTNLRQVNGKWVFHFEGDELKIGTRRGQTNVYEMEIPSDVVPYLEEYLHVWRPKLPHADEDRHVLLGAKGGGGMMTPKTFYYRLKVHVFRLTGKRFYPHLLRTIFTSTMLNAGMDINSVAYGLNDNPATVLQSYNELQGGIHQQSLQAAYARALHGNSHGNGTSP